MSAERRRQSQLRRLLGYIEGRRLEFVVSLVLVVVTAYLGGLVPVLIRDAVDRGVITGDYRQATLYGLLIVFVAVISGAASFAGRMLLMRSSQHAVYKLRVDAFNAILRQGMEFFNKTLTGQLLSRITNDAERVTGFISFRLRMLVYSTFLIAVSLYYMAGMSGPLTLIALATIGASTAVNALYARRVRPIYDEARHQTGVLASIAASALGGIRAVKALSAEGYIAGRFDRENRELYNLNVEAARVSALYGNAPFLIVGASMASMLYYGGKAILAGTLTVGELVAFLTYMVTLMWPLRALGFIIGDLQRSLAAVSRLFEVIDSAPRPARASEAEPAKPRGEVVVRDVWFTYHTGRTALRGVTLRVRPGGPTMRTLSPGSGKSTLLKLIAGLYEPQRGEVLIDGIPVSRLRGDVLARLVAYVPQEPFIFNRTIYENISLWDPAVKPEDVERAAKIAKIHDFISRLPDGYQTVVGERGLTLSGGQRQRLALARALARNPVVLLLDDPVSNLDAETEEALVRDLEEALRGRTVIMVSQRPSLARLADRIIVMEDGKIVGETRPGAAEKPRARAASGGGGG